MSLMLTIAALLIPDYVSLLCWIGTDLSQGTAVFLVSCRWIGTDLSQGTRVFLVYCRGPVREHPNT